MCPASRNYTQAKSDSVGILSLMTYRRLHLPVNARAKNMFSRDVKRLCFRCQTLKFQAPKLKLT